MQREVVLNGFQVEPALVRLMLRPDWSAERRTGAAWLTRFSTHPDSEGGPIPFVQFCSIHDAIWENEVCRKPELSVLYGLPSTEVTPGDFDPTAGYLIGFTDYCDSSICVDLRPSEGPRIIYECLAPKPTFATAFTTLDEFVDFYCTQHGA